MPTLHRMRTLPLLVIAAAALLAPGRALAVSGATAPVARAFVITGLVLGDQKIDASGKLGLQGDQLYASVGCNSIGGKVSLDGDLVTIADPLVQTEMACQGVAMDTEAALVKILQHGPFRITRTSWDGDGAAIMVQELDAPAPDRTLPPDEPVGSSPDPMKPDPGMSCPPVEIDPGFDGGSTSSDGSSGSGGGSTGTGGGTTGSGVGAPPDAGSGGGSGENPTGSAIAEPGAVPPATPAAEPGGDPDANATPDLDQAPEPSFVIEPAPSGIVVPDPGTSTDPGKGSDPGTSGPPIDLDPCARAYANDLAAGSGTGAIPPGDAAATAAHEKAVALGLDAATLVPAAAGALLIVGLFAAFAVRRWRATRPGTAADASR